MSDIFKVIGPEGQTDKLVYMTDVETIEVNDMNTSDEKVAPGLTFYDIKGSILLEIKGSCGNGPALERV